MMAHTDKAIITRSAGFGVVRWNIFERYCEKNKKNLILFELQSNYRLHNNEKLQL